jgi:hypothetical protein
MRCCQYIEELSAIGGENGDFGAIPEIPGQGGLLQIEA